VNEEMLNKMKCCAAASEANDYTRNVTWQENTNDLD
jgi:hypothetical protein